MGEHGEGMWEVVRRRSEDPKSAVRKSAVQVLHARLHALLLAAAAEAEGEGDADMMMAACVDARDVAALVARCGDASVLVRKQALDALTSLVSHACGGSAGRAEGGGGGKVAGMAARGAAQVLLGWVTHALPMVRDREAAVADRAAEGVGAVLLVPMAAAAAAAAGKHLPAVTRAVLRLMPDASRGNVQLACRMLARRKPSALPAGLTKQLLARLTSAMEEVDEQGVRVELDAVGAHEADVMWWVLEEAAGAQSSASGDYDALLRTLRHGSEAHAAAALRTVARMAAAGCASLGAPLASTLFAELVARLKAADGTPALLHEMVKAAAQVARALPAAAAAGGGKDWGAAVLASADAKMAPLVDVRLRAQATSDGASPLPGALAAVAADGKDKAQECAGVLGCDAMQELQRAVFLVGALALEGVKVCVPCTGLDLF